MFLSALCALPPRRRAPSLDCARARLISCDRWWGGGLRAIEIDRGPGQDPDPPEGLRVPRDSVRVDPGGKHAGRAAAEPCFFGVQAADAGEKESPAEVL